MTERSGTIQILEPKDIAGLLKAGKVLLIDVRDPAEHAAERIAGAVLYPLSTFDATTLPTAGPPRVIFHCGSGKQSLTAAEKRLAAGESHAAQMRGGLVAYKAASLPLIAVNS